MSEQPQPELMEQTDVKGEGFARASSSLSAGWKEKPGQ